MATNIITPQSLRYLRIAALSSILIVGVGNVPAIAQSTDFNDYVMRAVDILYKTRKGEGYDRKKAFTRDIAYGGGTVHASAPPKTMCVAAVAEVMITAINLYAAEKNDKSPYDALPTAGWNRMRPTDIRAHIWVDPRLDSYGTGDALVTFGIGKRVRFSELKPGSFINFNRTNKTGHAVVFIAYLDQDGREFSQTKTLDINKIAGFKYFSAQTRNSNGIGYGYAFFSGKDGKKYCPPLENVKPDCGIIYSTGQKMLNSGYMLHPRFWDGDQRDANLKSIIDGLFIQTRSRGPSFLDISADLTRDEFADQLKARDTMQLNPMFDNDQD